MTGTLNDEALSFYTHGKDYMLEVAKGNVPGHSSIAKFGENPDIDNNATFETIWDGGGTYVPPTVARIHNVVSTDADDAGTVLSSGTDTGGSNLTIEDTTATFSTDGVAAGDVVLNDTNCEIGIVTTVTSETVLTFGFMRSPDTGAIGTDTASGDAYRVVTNASTGASIYYVKGLDATFTEANEFVVMNGISNVATVNSYARQFRARAFGANATVMEGVATCTAQTDGTVSSQIVDGNNQTLMAVYTIPFGKIGYLTKWWGSLSTKGAASSVVRLKGGTLDGLGYIIQTRSINGTGTSAFDYEYSAPEIMAQGVDIWVEADSDTNNTGIASGFDILLMDA